MRVLDDWLLTPERVALHLPSAMAVLADPHLGYDLARRRGGEAVPARPVGGLLDRMRPALARHGVRRLVIAGDVLEDGRCRDVVADLCDWLERAGVELVAAVPGNHDRGLGEVAGLPVKAGAVRIGSWTVVHGDGRLPRGRVVHGHEHPCVRWAGAGPGGPIVAPCYLVGAQRLVLPAFSPDAAGVNVLGVARWQEYRCCVIAEDRVLDFGSLARGKSRKR